MDYTMKMFVRLARGYVNLIRLPSELPMELSMGLLVQLPMERLKAHGVAHTPFYGRCTPRSTDRCEHPRDRLGRLEAHFTAHGTPLAMLNYVAHPVIHSIRKPMARAHQIG